MKKISLITVAIIALFGCVVLVIDPAYAERLYDERNLVENLTVLVCIIAFIFLVILSFISYRRKKRHKFWLFLSLITFIFIGDEISWGMWWFGFEKPRIAGVGLDGFHDVLSISIGVIKMVRNYVRSIGILDIRSISIIVSALFVTFLLVYILYRWFMKNRKRIFRFFSDNMKWEPFFFLVCGIVLLALAMFIDDDNLVSFPHKRIVEESLELIASLLFLFAGISGLIEIHKKTKVFLSTSDKPKYRKTLD